MSLKARISRIENKLPEEDRTITELSYHGADPTEEEMDIAFKYLDDLGPPWKVMYVPHEFRHELEFSRITERTVIRFDEELGLYYDGEILFKLVEEYDKERTFLSGVNMIEIVNYYPGPDFPLSQPK